MQPRRQLMLQNAPSNLGTRQIILIDMVMSQTKAIDDNRVKVLISANLAFVVEANFLWVLPWIRSNLAESGHLE